MFIFLIISHLNIIAFAIINQNLITILYQLLNSKYAVALILSTSIFYDSSSIYFSIGSQVQCKWRSP